MQYPSNRRPLMRSTLAILDIFLSVRPERVRRQA